MCERSKESTMEGLGMESVKGWVLSGILVMVEMIMVMVLVDEAIN